MDADLIELCSTARTLDLAARAAPQDWPQAARALAGLCLGLESNATAVLRLVKAQDALIAMLRERVGRIETEVNAMRSALSSEHAN